MPTPRRNREYNETRKRQSDLKKKDINHDRALQKIHEDSVSRIQSQIDNFYLKYATSDGLTIGEAKRRASNFDVTQYFEKARKAVADKDFTPETNAWLKDYNRKMRISRLEVLKGDIQLELVNMTEEKEKYISAALEDSMKSEYKAQRKKIQEQINKHQDQVGILDMSTRSPIDKYMGIINADFYGNNFSDKIWGYARDMDKDIEGSLSRIYTDMMGFQQERERLKRKFAATDYEAQRLLRTEMRRVNSQLQEEMLKDNGFTHMIYVTEPGACEICAPLESLAVPIENIEIGVNQPPMHPNCYCSMYGHIEMIDIYGNSSLDETDTFKESDILESDVGEQATPANPANPYEFMSIDRSMTEEERVEAFRTVNKRVEEVIDEYKELTGVDVLQLYRERRFADRMNPYDDERAKFVKFAMEKVGYDGLPHRISNTDGYKTIYRGVVGLEDGSITAEDFEKRFRDGVMDISGAKSSVYGRGVYFAEDLSTAEGYAGFEGLVTKAYINLDDVKLLDTDQVNTSQQLFFDAQIKVRGFVSETEAYEFISSYGGAGDAHRELYAIFHGYDAFDNFGNYAIFNRTKVGVEE